MQQIDHEHQTRLFNVSTGRHQRTVAAKSPDRAAAVFFLKEQPQVVGFVIAVREIKVVGRDVVQYAYTPAVLERLFPELTCTKGPTANSFRVISNEGLTHRVNFGKGTGEYHYEVSPRIPN